MKKIIGFILSAVITFTCFGQEQAKSKISSDTNSSESNKEISDNKSASEVMSAPPVNDSDRVYYSVDHVPEFVGGMSALVSYLSTNIQYPAAAEAQKLQGRVVVKFVVDKEGNVTHVSVVDNERTKFVGGGCEEEAVRVIKAMPKWKPGIQKNEPVNVQYILPISFKLPNK